MREEVVDSNVFLRWFLKEEGEPGYEQATMLVEDLDKGRCLVHISMLVVAEVCATVKKQTGSSVRAYRVEKTLKEWIDQGRMKLYELNETRMENALKIAIRDKLKGPDAVIAQVSGEMNLPLRTYDAEVSNRFQGTKTHD